MDKELYSLKMLSKRAFVYVILVFIAVLSLLVFLYFKNRLTVSSEPLKAVPLDAAFIIRINDRPFGIRDGDHRALVQSKFIIMQFFIGTLRFCLMA